MGREDWKVADTFEVGGRKHDLTPGAFFKVKGERGTSYTFKEHVVHPSGAEWITAWGGPLKHEQWVTFPVTVEITQLKPPPRKK